MRFCKKGPFLFLALNIIITAVSCEDLGQQRLQPESQLYSAEVQEIADRLRAEYNAAVASSPSKYPHQVSGTYEKQYRTSGRGCGDTGCATSVTSKVTHSSNFDAKTQAEVDTMAKDLAQEIIKDMQTGKLQYSQISQPNWFEQRAAQELEAFNSGIRQSQSQSQYMGSSGRFQQQQQQQQQSYGPYYNPQSSYVSQTNIHDSSRTVVTHRPQVTSSRHHVYDHLYEERLPNYQPPHMIHTNIENDYGDTQVQQKINFNQNGHTYHRLPILIRPGSGSVQVNYTVSMYNRSADGSRSPPSTHVVTFNRNFTEENKREQIQSILEEITRLNRSQLHGIDDLLSSLVIEIDDTNIGTNKQEIQDEIYKLIEQIRNQTTYNTGWRYPYSGNRVTEEELLYQEVQELIRNFSHMINTPQPRPQNTLSSYILSIQHSFTEEERRTQTAVIQQEIKRLTEEIRVWRNAQGVSEEQRRQEIYALQQEIQRLRQILTEWNQQVVLTPNVGQVSSHIIQIEHTLNQEEKQRQTSIIQQEIERLRHELERWQRHSTGNAQQRQQQINLIWKEISTLNQIIEDWKSNQVNYQETPLSTYIFTIENTLTEQEKDEQSQVIQDEIRRLRHEMEQFSRMTTDNEQRRQEQIYECREEINKLTRIIEDWKATKPTLTPQNQLSTHIITIENNLTEEDKSYQSEVINTEIQRLRQELERWKHLQHVNEDKRRDQINLIRQEINKLTEIIEEWKETKATLQPENLLSEHIITIENTFTEEDKEKQSVQILSEIDRLRQELERWKHLHHVNEEKRVQQIQLINQEISKLSHIIQEWKETRPTIVPGNQLSQHIVTIEKTFTEEDRSRQNAVIQEEINRLRQELQRWSHMQNVQEEKRQSQIGLIKGEISKLTEIVEEWRESRPTVTDQNRLSTHFIKIENSLSEEEKVEQNSVIQQEIARLREELQKWTRLHHVNEQERQNQIHLIRNEINKLTEIVEHWKETRPTLTAENQLSTHIVTIERNLTEEDKTHQTRVIQDEINRLRQELHRWTQMANVNEERRQGQIQMIRTEIKKLTEIVEDWRQTKPTLTAENQLSTQIIIKENTMTEEEKVQQSAVIQAEIQRLRLELERWRRLQNVNKEKQQQQITLIQEEIQRLTEIVNDWNSSQITIIPGKQMSLHIISVENTLTEEDKRQQTGLIQAEISRLQQELERWNHLTHVNNQKKQQQVFAIWQEINALTRILEDWRNTQVPGPENLLSSHIVAIESTLTNEEKLLQTVIIKDEIARLKEELEKWTRETNENQQVRQREMAWIRQEIQKLQDILQNWQLTESQTSGGLLSAHILSIEHTLTEEQKQRQIIVIKEELVRLRQELEKWKRQGNINREDREQQVFWIRQEINKLNEILANWKAKDEIGTGGQLSTYILSIEHSLTTEQKDEYAKKINEELAKLNNELKTWSLQQGNTVEKQKHTGLILEEIRVLSKILEDWKLERIPLDFSKLSSHILTMDSTLSAEEIEHREKQIRQDIRRLRGEYQKWASQRNIEESERQRLLRFIQQEIDLLNHILEEWQRRANSATLLSQFIRSIEQRLNNESKYFYSLLIIQEIERLQREGARWNKAHESESQSLWYIEEAHGGSNFQEVKQRQLRIMHDEVHRLAQILREWGWRKTTAGRWIHPIYTQFTDLGARYPTVFIHNKNGSGSHRPPQKAINKDRGDQPPQQFEDDYFSEEELELEPGIGLYPVKPEIGLSTPAPIRLPPPEPIPVVVPQSQREYRRREYQKTTITRTNQAAVPQFHLTASASAQAFGGQNQFSSGWVTPRITAGDPNYDKLESMAHTQTHSNARATRINRQGVTGQEPLNEELDLQQQTMDWDDTVDIDLSQKYQNPDYEVDVQAIVKDITETSTTTEAPGFWKRLGEKAKNVFG
ncbi:trichohyalin [Phlebotomus papatasi]|uniref:trichohyalin n=1 Tax=Phlebotomus papatasi TaxID=29031 RepID=UPI0024846DD6|nr:trichohyalin [Phlebotomus papatasi]XP_055709285.1 trichohyalin [Phlebotomus papatasi]